MSSPKFSVRDLKLKTESTKLIKYFLASLTMPENDLWVNLSPYEKDRIIPHSFGLTEMGRDLLAEDYMPKQITASLIYPEDQVGKKFWKRIYEEASKKYGTTNIPVNTFNKVWIVPDKAVVFENPKNGTAFVVESRLKVMLEQDYLSLAKHQASQSSSTIGSQIVREIVIPELTREVNENKNFAKLRQVYNSLILATWFKKKIKDSILEQVYADKNKIVGLKYNDSVKRPYASDGIRSSVIASPKGEAIYKRTTNDVEYIYQQYLQAFKKGVFNFIKEDIDPQTQEIIPRKYFSGGLNMAMMATTVNSKGVIRYVKQMSKNAVFALTNTLLLTVLITTASLNVAKASETLSLTTNAVTQLNLTDEDRLVVNDTKQLLEASITGNITVHTAFFNRDYLKLAIKQQADQGNEYAQKLMADPHLANRVIGSYLALTKLTTDELSATSIDLRSQAESLRLLLGIDKRNVSLALIEYLELIKKGKITHISSQAGELLSSMAPKDLKRNPDLNELLKSDGGGLLLLTTFQGWWRVEAFSLETSNSKLIVEGLLDVVKKAEKTGSSLVQDEEKLKHNLALSSGYAYLFRNDQSAWQAMITFKGLTNFLFSAVFLTTVSNSLGSTNDYKGEVGINRVSDQVILRAEKLTNDEYSNWDPRIKAAVKDYLVALRKKAQVDQDEDEETRNALMLAFNLVFPKESKDVLTADVDSVKVKFANNTGVVDHQIIEEEEARNGKIYFVNDNSAQINLGPQYLTQNQINNLDFQYFNTASPGLNETKYQSLQRLTKAAQLGSELTNQTAKVSIHLSHIKAGQFTNDAQLHQFVTLNAKIWQDCDKAVYQIYNLVQNGAKFAMGSDIKDLRELGQKNFSKSEDAKKAFGILYGPVVYYFTFFDPQGNVYESSIDLKPVLGKDDNQLDLIATLDKFTGPVIVYDLPIVPKNITDYVIGRRAGVLGQEDNAARAMTSRAYKGKDFSIDKDGLLKGRIFSTDFIERERSISKTRKTIAFDLDQTLAVFQDDYAHYDPKYPPVYVLRPHIKEQIEQLAKKYRLVIWTSAAGDRVRKDFIKKFPELMKYFDLVITRENYDIISRDKPEMNSEEILNAYSFEKKKDDILEIYKETANNPIKDITLLGYSLIVDDHIYVDNLKADPDRDYLKIHPNAQHYKFNQIGRFRFRSTEHKFIDEESGISDLAVKLDKIVKGSEAMLLKIHQKSHLTPTGGIDLTPANMHLQTKISNGESALNVQRIRFRLDPAMLKQLQKAPGFTPQVINIKPMTDLNSFLGLKEQGDELVAV